MSDKYDSSDKPGKEEIDGLSAEEQLSQKKLDQIDKLITRLENTGLEEYIKLSQRTWKVLFMNLLSGMARGLGFALGTTLLLAVLYKIIKHMIEINIPYLTELLQEVLSAIHTGQQPL